MLSYFTILKHYFIIIPYHFTISSTSQNSIFIKILFLTIFYYLFPTAIYFQIAGSFFVFFIFFSLSLPGSLSLSRYIFRLLEASSFFHLFFVLSPMLSVTFSLYIFRLLKLLHFFHIFFTFSPMLSVTFSLPVHFPFSMPDCLSSLWVSLVLGVAGRWIVDRGSLRWIVDRFLVSFNFVGF